MPLAHLNWLEHWTYAVMSVSVQFAVLTDKRSWYWEHQIRDDCDFIRHVEYIHYNPVKHGLTESPKLWPYSTFHRYVKQGLYHDDWGADTEIVFGHQVGRE